MPLIIIPHEPQMPSRQSCSKWIASSPFSISCSLTTSSISRNDASGLMSFAAYSTKPPSLAADFWRHTWSFRFIVAWFPGYLVSGFPLATWEPGNPATSFVAPRRQLHFFVVQRLFVEARLAVVAGEFPRGDVQELVVIAQRLAIGRLMLDPEVAAARLLALQ